MRTTAPGRAPVRALVLLCLGSLTSASVLAAQSGSFGPLTSEEGSPLQRLSFTPVTEVADPVEQGSFRADLWFGFSNVFEADSSADYTLYLDMERLITTATVRYGLADGLEVGGRLGFETTGGGRLDPFLTWWHGLLHVGNADRERYPSDTFGHRLVDQNGHVRIDVPRRTMALEDVRLFAKLRLLGDAEGPRALALRGATRIPTSHGRVGRARTDYALMLLGRASWTRWHLHGMLSGSTLRASPELVDLLAGSAWVASLSVERELMDGVSGVLQYSLGTPSFRGFDSEKIDRLIGNVVFGAAGRFGDDWRWDIGFQEDVPAISPAIDFTLGIRLSRTW